MKRILISSLAVAGLVLGGLQGLGVQNPGADTRVAEAGNGFPNGPHFTLNVHGKKDPFQHSETCTDKLPGGGSVFIPLVGKADILLRLIKSGGAPELIATDECSFKHIDSNGNEAVDEGEWVNAGDQAVVQMPTGDYRVYARALGKPQFKNNAEPMVQFVPRLDSACTWVDNPDSPDGIINDGDDLACDLTVGTTLTDYEGTTLTRTKGKNAGVLITPLLSFTALWACPAAADLDINNDGDVTKADALADGYDTAGKGGDGDGIISDSEYAAFLTAYGCENLGNPSLFETFDVMIYGLAVTNKGTTLVNMRFYPMR